MPDGREAWLGLGDMWVDANDAHAKCVASVCDFHADPAQSDNSESGITEMHVSSIHTGHVPRAQSKGGTGTFAADRCPLALLLLPEVSVQISGEAQNIGKDVIGNHVVANGPHVGHQASMRD